MKPPFLNYLLDYHFGFCSILRIKVVAYLASLASILFLVITPIKAVSIEEYEELQLVKLIYGQKRTSPLSICSIIWYSPILWISIILPQEKSSLMYRIFSSKVAGVAVSSVISSNLEQL